LKYRQFKRDLQRRCGFNRRHGHRHFHHERTGQQGISGGSGNGIPGNTKQAVLIAWSTQAASPLKIEDAAARAQNVTVFIYRLNPALVTRNPVLR
jgi:hypothetical protein